MVYNLNSFAHCFMGVQHYRRMELCALLPILLKYCTSILKWSTIKKYIYTNALLSLMKLQTNSSTFTGLFWKHLLQIEIGNFSFWVVLWNLKICALAQKKVVKHGLKPVSVFFYLSKILWDKPVRQVVWFVIMRHDLSWASETGMLLQTESRDVTAWGLTRMSEGERISYGQQR